MFLNKHVVLLKTGVGQSGGLEKYASRIAHAFAAQGAKVSFLTTGEPPFNKEGSFSFHGTATAPWPSFLRMEQFDRFVQKWLELHPADLVFGMDRNRFQTHIRAGNGVHIAYLKSRLLTEGRWKHAMCGLNPMHRKILSLERAAFENPLLKKLFANSYMVRDQILQNYEIDAKKIEVIHNGVEWHEMAPDFAGWEEGRKEAFLRHGLEPDLFHFLFIGNGYLRKGLDRLLKAFARLKRGDIHLSVIGKDNKIEKYQTMAKKLGIEQQVRFFGPQKQIRQFYQLADVLVIPSFYDPFANVTIEALAMGLFVVSSRYNGGHEILTPQNGIAIEEMSDIDSIVEALQRSLEHRKTAQSAYLLRQSVAHLDFSHQLNRLIGACG